MCGAPYRCCRLSFYPMILSFFVRIIPTIPGLLPVFFIRSCSCGELLIHSLLLSSRSILAKSAISQEIAEIADFAFDFRLVIAASACCCADSLPLSLGFSSGCYLFLVFIFKFLKIFLLSLEDLVLPYESVFWFLKFRFFCCFYGCRRGLIFLGKVVLESDCGLFICRDI